MSRTLILALGGLLVLGTVSVNAQESVVGQHYGEGVHAYFAGDFLKSYESLSAAADAGCRDPRVFYFRGLVQIKLGRSPDGNLDFRKGSELETKDINRYYNVARALERVLEPGVAEAMGHRAFERIQSWSFEEDVRGLRQALEHVAPGFAA